MDGKIHFSIKYSYAPHFFVISLLYEQSSYGYQILMYFFSKIRVLFFCIFLNGCVSFPSNFPPMDSKEYLVIPKVLKVNNPFNTHYVGEGRYKLMGTIDDERFYKPQDPTLFSHNPMRYLRVNVHKKNEVCVLYVDLVNCIETEYEIINSEIEQ
ncbi:hypothetical protein BM526_15315 [Alteromonas mediterranea]|nr:hypothetical protein BM526_15315 [Alteromonas mediterranea]